MHAFSHVPGIVPPTAYTRHLGPGRLPRQPCKAVTRLICVRGWHQTMRDCYQMIDLARAHLSSSLHCLCLRTPPLMGRAVRWRLRRQTVRKRSFSKQCRVICFKR